MKIFIILVVLIVTFIGYRQYKKSKQPLSPNAGDKDCKLTGTAVKKTSKI